MILFSIKKKLKKLKKIFKGIQLDCQTNDRVQMFSLDTSHITGCSISRHTLECYLYKGGKHSIYSAMYVCLAVNKSPPLK